VLLLIAFGGAAATALILAFVTMHPARTWVLFGVVFALAGGVFVWLLPASLRKRAAGIVGASVAAMALYATLIPQATSGPENKLPSCKDVGNSSSGVKDATYFGAFRTAYDRAGGRNALGCPRQNDTSGYVHKWGDGYSQDLEGQHGFPARLMVLPPSGRVIVLQGTLNRDYTSQFDRNSAPQVGYPTSDPIACANARIVPLASGKWAPGVMITSPDQRTWVWLASPIWLRYKQLGGPFGRLGLPVGQSEITDAEPNQKFEHGSLRLASDKRTVRSDREIRGQREVSPVHPFNCPGLR